MEKTPTRRSALKSVTIGSGAILLPSVTAGVEQVPESATNQGRKFVVDLKITHEGNQPPFPSLQADYLVSSTRVEDGKLFAVGTPHNQVVDKNPSIIRTPDTVTTFSNKFDYEQSSCYLDAPYSRLYSTMITPESAYDDKFAFEVTSSGMSVKLDLPERGMLEVENGEVVNVTLPTRKITIPKLGEPRERTIEREDRTITRMVKPQIGTEQVPVTPTLNVKNHGQLEVHAVKDGMVGPIDASWMQKHIRSARQQDRDVATVNGSDVVIVSEGDQ